MSGLLAKCFDGKKRGSPPGCRCCHAAMSKSSFRCFPPPRPGIVVTRERAGGMRVIDQWRVSHQRAPESSAAGFKHKVSTLLWPSVTAQPSRRPSLSFGDNGYNLSSSTLSALAVNGEEHDARIRDRRPATLTYASPSDLPPLPPFQSPPFSLPRQKPATHCRLSAPRPWRRESTHRTKSCVSSASSTRRVQIVHLSEAARPRPQSFQRLSPRPGLPCPLGDRRTLSAHDKASAAGGAQPSTADLGRRGHRRNSCTKARLCRRRSYTVIQGSRCSYGGMQSLQANSSSQNRRRH